MPVIYEPCDQDVEDIRDRMTTLYHRELADVEVSVGLFFATVEKDEHGEPLGMAVALNGYPCAAKVKINSYRDRVEGKPDATIYIDKDEWEGRTTEQRNALIDHELEHLEVQLDSETNAPKSDDLGRPKLKMRKHDWQMGWFDSIARRHADASYEVEQAKTFADKCGQLYFGWSKPPESGEASTPNSGSAVDGFPDDDAKWTARQKAKAVAPLAELVASGSGVTSIGFQAGNGPVVTIDKAAAQRILRKARGK